MANNPNDPTPKPAPNTTPGLKGPHDPNRPPEEADLPETDPMTGVPRKVQPSELDSSVDYGAIKPVASGSSSSLFNSGTSGGSGVDPASSVGIPTDPASAVNLSSPLSGMLRGGEPASNAGLSRTDHDADADIGNLEPPSPVAPASGWIDSGIHSGSAAPPEPPRSGVGIDLEGEPTQEGSDIFSRGGIPKAKPVGGSDVLAATAYGDKGPVKPEPPGRGSDVALSFDQPPGGSTIESGTGNSDLPVAEELSDAPQYGSTPENIEDTSSILSELVAPGDVTVDDSSAIRLEAPGVPKTHHPSSGTEFDLTIGEGEIPPELAAAAEAAESGASEIRLKRPPSDPDTRTMPEINLDDAGRVRPIDPKLRPDDPSSIFDSINDPVVFRRPGESGRIIDDAAVEFSDHPDAETEKSESGSSSSLFGTSGRPRRPRPPSNADFQLPPEPAGDSDVLGWKASDEKEDSGILDWKSSEPEEQDAPGGDSSNILLRGARTSQPRTEPVGDQTAPTRPARTPPPPGQKPPAPRGLKGEPDSVEVDWLAASSTEKPAVAPAAREHAAVPRKPKERPERDTAPTKRGGLIGGMVGAGIAIAACTAIYLSGAVPNNAKETAKAPTPPQGGNTPGGTNAIEQPPADTVPGQTRLFARIQELGKVNAVTAAPDDADLQRAREELKGVADNSEAAKSARGEWEAVQATIYLGISHQVANERETARKVYLDGMKKFPKYASTFQGALDRLDATDPKRRETSRRLTPAEAELLVYAIVLLQPNPAARTEPEAGDHFWKAVKLAGEANYAEAGKQIALAKAAHVKQAKTTPGGGVNPLSDPLHEIFPRCCDDLKAYWDLRAAIYSNKAIAELVKKDGAAKAVAELAKRADAAVTVMADLKAANDKLAKAMSDYKDASEKLTKAQGDYKDTSEKLTKSEKDLKETKDLFVKIEKDYKAAEAGRLAAEKKATDETTARAASEKARKRGDDLIAAFAKELQSAKLLPEKYDDAALVAAQKSAALRASDSKLTDLIAAETKNLKDAHSAEVKKLNDNYTAETKKLMDGFATGAAKIKEDHVAEMKKLAEKYVADMKNLNENHDAKVKALENAVAEEKKAAEALAAKFKVDLGNAMSPAQALDVWLPLLTDLRRASDADPALATAMKVMSTSPNDSEDSAKARTVAGLAHFLKGDMTKAREMFVSAKASPAYKAAAGKSWAQAADTGLQSITDPLASFRRPVEPRKSDVLIAARHLDTGVKAYKAGRFADAAAALAESVKADSTDPVAWYFLGAAKWETAGADQAKKEFEQGAEQERRSPMTARTIGNLIAPIQGPARDALTAARP
jgi:hypothetical protein